MNHSKVAPYIFSIKITIVHVFLCSIIAGIINYFSYQPLGATLVHATICLIIYSIATFFSIITANLSSNLIRSSLFTIFSSVLILVYIGNSISNYFWKANINLNLISRMVGHYFSLYEIITTLTLSVPLICLALSLAYFYSRLFKSLFRPPKNILFFGLIWFAFILIPFIQLTNTYYGSNKTRLGNYFYGEMLVDLFREYTDSHQDYLADADRVEVEVSHSTSYVTQLEANIDTSKKNIVLVIIDCLRADHLPIYGYERDTTPFIRQFIEQHNGEFVSNFFSMCDESKCGIRSTLTSQDFTQQNSSQAADYSLHSTLKKNGYQINFLLSSDHAFGGLKKSYFPYDFYLDGLGFKNYALNDDRGIVSTLTDWPDYNGTPNYFHFHLFSAHEASVEYGKYLGNAVHGIEPGFLVEDPISPRYFSRQYAIQKKIDWMDNKIYQTDLVLSKIFELLSDKGYMQNTLVVITGDHGQGLNEHGYVGHISGLYNESLRVPFLLADTSGDPLNLKETEVGSQLDIAPTIINMLGLEPPALWQGKTLQAKKTDPTMTIHYIPNRSNSFARIFYDPTKGELYKYMQLSTRVGTNTQHFLFDLIKDPQEKTNLLLGDQTLNYHLELIKKWQLDLAFPTEPR